MNHFLTIILCLFWLSTKSQGDIPSNREDLLSLDIKVSILSNFVDSSTLLIKLINSSKNEYLISKRSLIITNDNIMSIYLVDAYTPLELKELNKFKVLKPEDSLIINQVFSNKYINKVRLKYVLYNKLAIEDWMEKHNVFFEKGDDYFNIKDFYSIHEFEKHEKIVQVIFDI